MDKTLKETIEKIQRDINSLHCSLNSGGCICFVRLIAEQLYYRNINYKVVVDESRWTCNQIKDCFKNKVFKIDGVYHVLIKVDDEYFDGLKFHNKVGYCINCTHPADLKMWEQKKYAWNNVYDRKHFNPIINKIIKKHFKNYDKIKNRVRY